MEITEFKSALDGLEKKLKEHNNEKSEALAAEVKAMKAEVEEAKKSYEAGSKKLDEKFQKQFDELATAVTNMTKIGSKKSTSFSDAFGDAVEEAKSELASMAKTKKKVDTSLELKAPGDISFANFGVGAYEAATTDVRESVYQAPFSPLFLRSILPAASTDSAAIQYLRENGGEGAAAVWDEHAEPLVNKPQVDYDFELVTETVDWIAGYTRIHRSMLDDMPFLRTYIPNQLIFGSRGILVAENSLIYSTLSDPANSVVYDGSKTIPVEILYDAALGQIRDNYFSASHIIMNNRDFVSLIALNKAVTSGEYDLPPGAVIVNGPNMTIGGVPVIGVPNVPAGEFIVLDNRATQFVTRMSTEVRFSEEDRDNFVKNLVTIRAEERAAILVFNENAVITGSFGS